MHLKTANGLCTICQLSAQACILDRQSDQRLGLRSRRFEPRRRTNLRALRCLDRALRGHDLRRLVGRGIACYSLLHAWLGRGVRPGTGIGIGLGLGMWLWDGLGLGSV